MVIITLTHPEEVVSTDRSKEHFTMLTLFNTTRVKIVHKISKAILCFLTLWFYTNEFSFSLGNHDVLMYLKLSITWNKGSLHGF